MSSTEIVKPYMFRRVFFPNACLLLCCAICGCAENAELSQDWSTRLRTLSYTRTAIGKRVAGVVHHEPESSYPGVHVYTVSGERRAMFLDMRGQELHSLFDKRRSSKGEWEFVEPYEDDFLAVVLWQSLLRLDWDSNVVWEVKLPFHHDVSIAPNGDIFGLIVEETTYPELLPHRAVYDVLVQISPDGKLKRKYPLGKIIAKHSELRSFMQSLKFPRKSTEEWGSGLCDAMHTNTVEVLATDFLVDGTKLFEEGQVLLCFRSMNLIAVLDLEREEFVWHWGTGELQAPHCPTVTEDRLMIFDNGAYRGYSRVLELNPLSNEVTREISGQDKDAPFFTPFSGHAQRLPNGNTLIVSSAEGRVFELSKNGDVVWDFFSFTSGSARNTWFIPYRVPRLVDAEARRVLERVKAARRDN